MTLFGALWGTAWLLGIPTWDVNVPRRRAEVCAGRMVGRERMLRGIWEGVRGAVVVQAKAVHGGGKRAYKGIGRRVCIGDGHSSGCVCRGRVAATYSYV